MTITRRSITTTILTGAVLAVSMGVAPVLAAGERGERSAVRTVLGGSFFPFERSFPRVQSERCKRLVDRKRSQRDDNILNGEDVRSLRRNGCRNFSFY